jgi:CMP-N-acetylneuraminic acid synthetase
MVEAAVESRLLDRVIVSTDHPDIARIAREYGAEVPFMRPADISEDVPSELVTQHAVRFVEAEGYPVRIVLTMQPTTPFCASEDIDACIAKMLESDMDTVFTACEVHERPEWMYRKIEDRVVPFSGHLVQGDTGISQKLERLYIPNGAVWATRRSVLMDRGLITGADSGIVVMSRERSVDIDDPVDFVIAEALAQEFFKATV